MRKPAGASACWPNWSPRAGQEIQNDYRAWRFLTLEFPETAEIDQGATAFTAESFNLADWAEWIPGTEAGTVPLTVWPSEGDQRGEEREIFNADYTEFRDIYQRGTSREITGPPQIFSIDPTDRFVVWPIPDQDYRISGTYRRAAQELVADADVPIILDQFQDTLVWKGALLLARYDEADSNVLYTTGQGVDTRMAAMRRRYLPVGTGLAYAPLGSGAGSFSRPSSPRFVS